MQISVRERRRQRPVLKYPAVEESPGDRREPATQDRVQRERPSGRAAGVVFAPTPRDYTIRLNKKEKRLALKSVLTSKVQENKLIVVDELKFDEIKTKNFANVMNNLKAEKALVVLNENDANVGIVRKKYSYSEDGSDEYD